MKFQSAELIRCGFSEDGQTAYCDVDVKPEPSDNDNGLNHHGLITVKVYVPVGGGDTLDQIRQRATTSAVGILRVAAAASGK